MKTTELTEFIIQSIERQAKERATAAGLDPEEFLELVWEELGKEAAQRKATRPEQ